MHRRPAESVSTSSSASAHDLLRAVLEPLVRLLMTAGLGREEIRQTIDELATELRTDVVTREAVCIGPRQRDCMDLLFKWHHDKEFMTSCGRPARLPMDGPIGSFRALCEKTSVTHSAESLLDTLLQFEAVALDNTGLIDPRTPTLILGPPNPSSFLAADGVLKQLAGFIRVIEHNVVRAATRDGRRFERLCSVVVAEELLPIANRVARERGQEFIDGIDEWLERQRSIRSPSNRYVELGVGAYLVDLGRYLGE